MSENAPKRSEIHHERRQNLILRAAIVGTIAGVVAVVFQYLVKIAEDFAQGAASHLSYWAYLVLPLAGATLGALSSGVTRKYAPEASGSGIPHVKAVLMNLRKLRPEKVIPVKLGMGLVALAGGMSLGREGPTVQISAAIAQLIGKWFKVPRRSMTPLISAGSGAGLAAAFNAPLAGFIFVMEELKREMSPLTYGTALIASVFAVAVKRIFYGQLPEFKLGVSDFVPISALPLVAVVGVLTGLLAIAFNRGIIGFLDIRDKFNFPGWVWGAIVGATAGLTLVVLPKATGGGHHVAEALLKGDFPTQNLIGVLFLLLVVKLFLTVFSFSSGAPGGIFAPMLVMGALLGYLLGTIFQAWFPGLGIVPSFFATIGMAAFFGASVRAPLTGVMLIFEMTAEYRLLYALLLGAFSAYIVAELLRDKPVYEALLERLLHKGSKELTKEVQPRVVDLFVEPDSEFDGKAIKDLPLPPGCLVVQIQRGDHNVVPNGSTVIAEGDIVTLVSENTVTEEWVALFDAARAPV